MLDAADDVGNILEWSLDRGAQSPETWRMVEKNLGGCENQKKIKKSESSKKQKQSWFELSRGLEGSCHPCHWKT